MSATVETPVEVSTDNGRSSIETSTGEEWRTDAKGRAYVPRKGRSGVVYRQRDNETVDEARARDAKGPRDRRPKPKKTSSVPKAPAPTQKTIAELEFLLTELFRAPEMVTALQGDEWATMHFDREAPVLARNLAHAAEHNPWLRSKIEAAVTGEGVFLFKIVALAPLISAAIAYIIPPLIYYLDPGFIPAEARERFNVPRRPSSETRQLLRERRSRERDEEIERERREMEAIAAELRAERADTAPPETPQAAESGV